MMGADRGRESGAEQPASDPAEPVASAGQPEPPGCGPKAIVVLVMLVVTAVIVYGPWTTTEVFMEGRLFVAGTVGAVGFVGGGLVVRRGRWWGDLISLGSLAAMVMAAAIVLAHPGGRHPVMMGFVGLTAGVLGYQPSRRVGARGSPRWGWALAVGWCVVCLAGLWLGASDAPTSMTVRLAQDEMDAAAAERLTERQHGFFPDGCHSRNSWIGPYEYRCGRVIEGSVYFFMRQTPGVIDEGQATLAYSPNARPEGCVNHLAGDWYEIYSPRGTDGCAWGLG